MGICREASDYPNGLLDYVNQRRNYAPTDFNQTHIFNETYFWRLPFGQGSHLATTGVVSNILGGWELSGMWQLTSGFPLNFSCTCSGFNTPGSQAFPNISGTFKKLKAIETSPWFDTTVFSQPPAGTQGDVGNYVYAGPRFFNLNASIFRNIRITERYNFEFRSEWFNLTNTPQFSNPNTTYGSSSFGLVTGAAGSPRTISMDGKLTF